MYVRRCVVLLSKSIMTRMNVKRLINLVHARPALWDQKHDEYNNKSYLKQIWEEIGDKMDCTAEGCKLKWRSLRDVYRRELKKYQSRLNDPNKLDKNLPRWFYFKELQFLTEHLSGLENITESPQENEEYFESMYVKSEPDLLDDEEITLEADDDILLTLTDGKSLSDDRRRSEYCYQIADTSQLEENQFERSVKYYRDSSSKRTLDEDRGERSRKKIKVTEIGDKDGDSDYHFLMSLLPFLRTIPQRRKMLVRSKIQNVFCEEVEAEASSS